MTSPTPRLDHMLWMLCSSIWLRNGKDKTFCNTGSHLGDRGGRRRNGRGFIAVERGILNEAATSSDLTCVAGCYRYAVGLDGCPLGMIAVK